MRSFFRAFHSAYHAPISPMIPSVSSSRIAAAAFLIFATPLLAQTPATPARKPPSYEDQLKQAIDAVDAAKANGSRADAEMTSATADRAAKEAEAVATAARVRDTVRNAPTAAPSSSQAAALNEARTRLGQATGTAHPTDKPAPANAKSAQPAQSQDTVITCQGDAFYSNKDNLAIFNDSVFVRRPDLRMWGDKFEVLMKKGALPDGSDDDDGPKPARPAEPAAEKKKDDGLGSDNVEKALMRGRRVVIIRRTAEDDIVANCREAIYDGKTGDMVLRGDAEVLRNMQVHITVPGDSTLVLDKKTGNARYTAGTSELIQDRAKAKEIRARMTARTGDPASADASKPAPSSPAPPPVIPPPPRFGN